MKDITAEEFERYKANWKDIRKSEDAIDYSKFINPKIHRRYIMEKKADDVIYRKRNLMKKEIAIAFKDEINQSIKSDCEKFKPVIINGVLVFIKKEDE